MSVTAAPAPAPAAAAAATDPPAVRRWSLLPVIVREPTRMQFIWTRPIKLKRELQQPIEGWLHIKAALLYRAIELMGKSISLHPAVIAFPTLTANNLSVRFQMAPLQLTPIGYYTAGWAYGIGQHRLDNNNDHQSLNSQ